MPAGPAEPAACDSCGLPTEELVPVRRVYVMPPGPAAVPLDDRVEPRTSDAVEHWCVACATQFPCEVAED
jgi:hypothetical protein